MYDIMISVLAVLMGLGVWGLLLFVTEMRCAQRGWDTWDWAKRIYSKSPLLQRVRW